jgi:hypothetical protein
MLGSALVYLSLAVACAGTVALIRPLAPGFLATRTRGIIVIGIGLAGAAAALLLPAFESRVPAAATRLDEFVPAWQFREIHTMRIAAAPARAFDAIRQVRADEIVLFRALTWIRRGGRALPPGILNAGSDEGLIAVAVKGGFITLADDAPREIVIGTVVAGPPGARGPLTPAVIKAPPQGFAIAAMNFIVTPDGPNASIVSTETRVFATSAGARRRFAAYWRVIYPGSALIRRMWLRAIARRATEVKIGSPSAADDRQTPSPHPRARHAAAVRRLGSHGTRLFHQARLRRGVRRARGEDVSPRRPAHPAARSRVAGSQIPSHDSRDPPDRADDRRLGPAQSGDTPARGPACA